MRNAQLRRGLYALAPPYLKATPHPFHVVGRLVLGSYVSSQSALAWHGLIPEHVPVTTSVTSSRPGVWKTPLGVFEYRHLRWVRGGAYLPLEVAAGQPGQRRGLGRPASDPGAGRGGEDHSPAAGA